MKRITALLHPNRIIGEVVHALAAAGHRRFSVVHGQGLLQALRAREQTYSVELGELITTSRSSSTCTASTTSCPPWWT